MLLGLTGETYAHANEVSSQQNQQEKPSQSQINTESANLEKGINSYLGLIEKMPESVADQGIDSGVAWLNKNKTEDYEGWIINPINPFSIKMNYQHRVVYTIDEDNKEVFILST